MQKYQENLAGRVAGALVALKDIAITVTDKATGLPATLFSDDGVTPLAQPLTTDVDGYFAFYAANGTYLLSFSGPAVPSGNRTIELYDADDGFLRDGGVSRSVKDKLGDIATLADFATADAAVLGCAGKRLIVGAGETVTINVPGHFATPQAALTAISSWAIANTGSVKIQVADGNYALLTSILLNHPYGSRIQLLGNTVNPDACTLTGPNPPTFDLIVCSNGNTFGLLDGFKLDLSAKASSANNYTGVLAMNGATIVCGSHVKVNNWYYGIAARNGAMVVCPSATVSNAGDVGIWAFAGSSVYAPNALVSGAIDSNNGLGFGMQAEYGSSLDCSGASATGCLIAGIAALSNSQVRAPAATASTNTGSGFFARDGGTVECHGATANNNTRYGVEVLADGHVYYNAITTTGNTISNFAPRAYFDNGTLGARLVADDGDMRFDVSGARSMFFNSSGGLQFRIDHTANVANQYAATGSAAGSPVALYAKGTDANIAAQIIAKGTEGVHLYSYGNAALRAYNTAASTVNYAQVEGSVTGAGVSYKARGSDTNIDLILSPKGAGAVQFGSLTANADAPVTGYITIKDSGGTLRKLAVIA